MTPIARAALLLATALLVACATKHPENPGLDEFPPGIVGSTDVTYYDIHGRTAAELATQMRTVAPQAPGGFTDAHSLYRWNWHSRNDGGGRCDLTSVQVTMVTQMMMPRWTPPADTAPGVTAQWQAFITAVNAHQVGHKDISATGARAILERLKALKTFCNDLQAETKRVTDAELANIRENQAVYDVSTRRGATQGAVFIPRPR